MFDDLLATPLVAEVWRIVRECNLKGVPSEIVRSSRKVHRPRSIRPSPAWTHFDQEPVRGGRGVFGRKGAAAKHACSQLSLSDEQFWAG